MVRRNPSFKPAEIRNSSKAEAFSIGGGLVFSLFLKFAGYGIVAEPNYSMKPN